jgi:hypothetical protein
MLCLIDSNRGGGCNFVYLKLKNLLVVKLGTPLGSSISCFVCHLLTISSCRPHPNECSGSDLDGDIYFVSWDPDLIPTRMVAPMDYTPAPTETLDHDVVMEVF